MKHETYKAYNKEISKHLIKGVPIEKLTKWTDKLNCGRVVKSEVGNKNSLSQGLVKLRQESCINSGRVNFTLSQAGLENEKNAFSYPDILVKTVSRDVIKKQCSKDNGCKNSVKQVNETVFSESCVGNFQDSQCVAENVKKSCFHKKKQ